MGGKRIQGRSMAHPQFGSSLLARRAEETARGVVDCHGLITIFWAWAFPCTRTWHSVVTIHDLLPQTRYTVYFDIDGDTMRRPKRLAEAAIEAGPGPEVEYADPTIPRNLNTSLNARVSFAFPAGGTYHVNATLKGTPVNISTPVSVILRAWPVLSDEEIKFAKANDVLPKAIRANVHCAHCHHAYVLEEAIENKAKSKGGTIRFPESGRLRCVQCARSIPVKDIQGQLRQSLKEKIQEAMKS